MTVVRRIRLGLLWLTLGGCALASPSVSSDAPAVAKPRVVVTADPELDDSNSLVRYLLYSTDFRTEGLIYASSGYHWKGDGTGKKWSVPNREYNRLGLNLCPCESWRWAPDEQFIDDALTIYEQVYPNLRVHNADYPAPAELKSKVRWGNVEFDGDISKNSPGSDLIKALLLDDEPGPIYLLAWGGLSTIARALKSIQEQYQQMPEWSAVYQKVSRKAVLSPSGDQDDMYAKYIRPNWPDIRTLPSGGATAVALSYGAGATASAENAVYYGVDWTKKNISDQGPLGAFYRVWGDGKQMVKNDIFDYFGLSGYTAAQLQAMGYIVWTPPRPKGEFLGEGDTFTYLNLLDNGLVGYDDGTRGGWAGYGLPNVAPLIPAPANQRDAIRSYDDLLRIMERVAAAPRPASPDPNSTPAAQNAFAARMTWSVTPAYDNANHEPVASIRGSSRLSARPGETVRLQGIASDPDGNALTLKWWRWKDVDTYPGPISITHPTSLAASVQIPADATEGQTIHLILEATDNGAPALTRYQRVVVSVRR
ncbi:MAG: nucleoside hydrolase-like domain-containing protein [Gemmatimonadaceae bacterium]